MEPVSISPARNHDTKLGIQEAAQCFFVWEGLAMGQIMDLCSGERRRIEINWLAGGERKWA